MFIVWYRNGHRQAHMKYNIWIVPENDGYKYDKTQTLGSNMHPKQKLHVLLLLFSFLFFFWHINFVRHVGYNSIQKNMPWIRHAGGYFYKFFSKQNSSKKIKFWNGLIFFSFFFFLYFLINFAYQQYK